MSIIIRGCHIGEGRPKVIIPIVEASESNILERALEFSELCIDCVEWRVDWFEQCNDMHSVVSCLQKIRVALKDKLLLVTLRTKTEGGEVSLTHQEYLDFIIGQLSELEDITYRKMMGEYIIYFRGKIVGGIYDDRLLVKPVESAVDFMSNAVYELPYEGAKEMLLVDEVDDKNFLTGLFNAMYDELPVSKKKK